MAAQPPLRHVAMLPFMAKGHAMPLLHLARVLLSRRLASAVTFFTTPRNAPFIWAGLAGCVGGAAVVELSFPSSTDESAPQSMDELPSTAHFVEFVDALAALRPAFAAALARVEPKPDVLVHDGFLLWATDVADELNLPRLVTLGMGGFASYACRAVMEHRPHAELGSPSDPFTVQGLPSLQFTRAEFSPPFDDPEPAGPHWDFVRESCRRMYSSRGIFVNSFSELESVYIDLWNQLFDTKMWAIGPLCLAASEPARTLDLDISDWLDARLAVGRPVLYVAFGSQAELSREQLEEIAVGLDRSGLDFLWVVRSKWFTAEDRLNDQFKDRGKVVEGFIDQLGVLGHKSVKGFFTHCGWNSVLESISMGVPILAFPMAAEQKLNAKFVVEVAQVGLRVSPRDDVDKKGAAGLVVSGDVQVLARELIFGEEGRRAAARASDLSLSSREALEVGGSSFENLELMIREISVTHSKSE